jgi:type IV pilus assembly protein PilP
MKPSSLRPPHRCVAGPPARRRGAVLLPLTLALAALCGCADDHEELRQWMEGQRRQVKPNVSPLEAPKKFKPQEYAASESVEPFSTQKLTIALKQEARQPSSLMAAEANRRKEPLEAFPLDDMSMVGSLMKPGGTFALLRVGNLLYQVKAGDYIGQNYGKITKISETGIELREIVQDAVGEWIERPATLQLQEKAQ